MDLEHRVEVLEQELQILKSQIQATLLEIQEQVLTSAYPVLRADEVARANQASSNAISATSDRQQTLNGMNNGAADDMEAATVPMVRRVNLEDAKSAAPRSPEATPQYAQYTNPPTVSNPTRASRAPIQEPDDYYETEYDEPPPPAPVRRVKLNGRRVDPEIEQRPPQARRVRQPQPLDDDSDVAPTRSNGRRPTNEAKRPASRRKVAPPVYEDDEQEEPFEQPPQRVKKRQSAPEETQPDRHDMYEEEEEQPLSFAPTAEIPDWTALNRLAEWVGGKVKQVGKRRARELIEANAQKGFYTEQIKSVLLQLVALYEGDGSVITRRVDAVLESLAEPFAQETEKFAPNDYIHNVDQNLVMRLITGLQNVGIPERKKRG